VGKRLPLNGGDGDDYLRGNEGNNILNGGNGNDILHYRNLGDSFDGGNGRDILKINELVIEIDLSAVTISNIEEIDMLFNGDNNLTLTLQDVLDTTDLNNQLIISGDAGDSVTSTGQSWIQGAVQNIDGQDYHVYTFGTGTFLVDTDITQNIS